MIDWILKKLRPFLCRRGYHPLLMNELETWIGLFNRRLHARWLCRACKKEFTHRQWDAREFY